MAKYPNKVNIHCVYCNKHTIHKVCKYKTGKTRKNRQGVRRANIKPKPVSGQSMPVFRKKAKTSKKGSIKLTCQECEKIQQLKRPRAKYFSVEAKLKKPSQVRIH